MRANSISRTSCSQTLAAHWFFSVQTESFQGPQTQFIMRWSWRLKSLITLITLLSKEKYFASGYILNLFGTNVALKGFFSADEAFRCGAASLTSPLKAVSQEVYCIRSNFISAGCFKLYRGPSALSLTLLAVTDTLQCVALLWQPATLSCCHQFSLQDMTTCRTGLSRDKSTWKIGIQSSSSRPYPDGKSDEV